MAEHTLPVALKRVCDEPAASHGARVRWDGSGRTEHSHAVVLRGLLLRGS